MAETVEILPSSTHARQNVEFDHPKPILLTAARADAQIRSPHNDPAGMIILTLEANNIQVQTKWRVTSAADSFAITNGTLSLTPKVINQAQILVATIYAIDEFRQLNPAYGNLTATALLTVEIIAPLSLATVPSLMVYAGQAATLHTLSASGIGTAMTYTIVAGNDLGYFTLGSNNGFLAINTNAAPGSYNLSVEVHNEYGSKDGAVVMVEVILVSIQGDHVVTSNGQTHFRFPPSGVSYGDLGHNYYIYYRGRYFEPGANNAYRNHNFDLDEVYLPLLIDDGSDDFSMVHKSIIDGTEEAGYITDIVKSYLREATHQDGTIDYIDSFDYQKGGAKYVQLVGSANIVQLSPNILNNFNCGGKWIRISRRDVGVDLHDELLGGLTKSLTSSLCAQGDNFYWTFFSDKNPNE